MRSHLATIVAVLALVAAGCKATNTTEDPNTKASNGEVDVKNATAHSSTTQLKPAAVKIESTSGHYDRPGFNTYLSDGRLWVFAEGDEGIVAVREGKEPAKHVTLVRAGPGAMTLKGPDRETLEAYMAVREGFYTEIVDGRIWVFRPGSDDLATFLKAGEPAKSVTRPRAGPMNMTVRGPDMETVMEYVTAKPGFRTFYVDGRLWVFPAGSADIAAFEKVGEPAKHVTIPRGGPFGLTIRGPDRATIAGYMASTEGFNTFLVDGRIWVFRLGDPEVKQFLVSGEPAKFITMVRAGPMNLTVRAPDTATAKDYLRTAGVAN
jgi:hypothetical protein